MEFLKILNKQLTDDKYYSIEDLRMNRKYGFLLSSSELSEFLEYKESLDSKNIIEIPLESWNSKKMYYYVNKELSNALADYKNYFKEDYDLNHSIYVDRNIQEISIGIISSELEGTLKIEGVNTTRRQIENIIKNKDIKDSNSRIIYNMYMGLDFVSKKPEFTKENLKKLYDILSNDCLDDEDIISIGNYRNDIVYISNYTGCPQDRLESCMNSLFKFVNDYINGNTNKIDDLLVPFIVHYYIIYIHPYFDYNGRTARMVQIWIFLLLDSIPSLYLSEAINDNKNLYYRAIENSRNSHNDLSYFFIYLVGLCNSYYLVHKNLDSIKYDIESRGETLSQTELHYLKRIIVNKKIGWFNYKGFIGFCGLDVTKQGALKILNNLENKKLIISRINSSKEKIFTLNDDIIMYQL